MAYWRAEAGDVSTALAEFAALLDDQVRALGGDHPHTLSTRHELASWTARAGDVRGGLLALEAVFDDRVRALGPNHPHAKATRDAIAYWRGRSGADGVDDQGAGGRGGGADGEGAL
ncbi:tetratricopeptide repeat protein [Actinokineospora cianjurensis]|uniref:tetratricopeptide repeat protein n=1 Tax=Actinokineospora cianjurensis TaxID=585224 RepID=UPI000EB4B78C